MASQIEISVRDLAGIMRGCCPRCFWITYHVELPYPSPFPGVFREIDRATKQAIRRHLDRHRRLPGWFPPVGRVVGYMAPGRLQWEDLATGVVLRGQPDEIFRLADGSYHIVDYKTARLTEGQKAALADYTVQLNGYAYLAERLGYAPVSGLSLVYLEPQWLLSSRDGTRAALEFKAVRRRVPLDPDGMIPPLLRRARQILLRPAPPAGDPDCPDCRVLEELVRRLR